MPFRFNGTIDAIDAYTYASGHPGAASPLDRDRVPFDAATGWEVPQMDYQEVYGYDAEGNRTSAAMDEAPGLYSAPETIEAYAYDADGRRISLERGDLVFPALYRERYTYDPTGLLETTSIDFDADDWFDNEFVFTYTLDEAGRVSTSQAESQRDTAHYRQTYTYDVAGNLQTWDYDTDADWVPGYVDWRRSYIYDGEGLRTLEEYDEGIDGTVEFIETLFYGPCR